MTGHFNWSQMEFIQEVATSVKWRIEEMVERGEDFDAAKARAIYQAQKAWKHLPGDTVHAILTVCWSISLADLSPRTRRVMKANYLALIEKHRGYRAGWIERLLYRMTGMVFSVSRAPP